MGEENRQLREACRALLDCEEARSDYVVPPMSLYHRAVEQAEEALGVEA